jgi:autotransporter passenger strand-loop-strand repeat protein
MQINVTYDASVAGAPAGFVAAIQYVVGLYENLFTNTATININVGWGEFGGNPITPGDAANSRSHFQTFTYAQVRQALVGGAQSSVQVSADATLPSAASSPFGSGTSIGLTTANAKALGLIDPNGGANDGSIGFSSNLAWSFDPNATPPGEHDFIAEAEHEISEVMGRASSDGTVQPNNNNNPTWRPMDFFRYSAPGQRDLSAGIAGSGSTAYFSIDNGNTNLGTWNNDPAKGDLGDWQFRNGPGPGGNDAFGSSGPGRTNRLTMTDLALMNVIGWDTSDLPNTVANGLTDWVAAGQTAVGMTVLSGGLQEIGSGGVAYSAVVSGGTQTIDKGGTARGTTVDVGGAEYVAGGGITSGTILDGGTEVVRGTFSPWVLTPRNIAGAATETTITSGSEIVEAGGVGIATTIGDGTLEVMRGGMLEGLKTPGLIGVVGGPVRQIPAVAFAAGGDGTLRLDASASFAPDSVSIAGFAGNDKLDLSDIGFGGHTTVGFAEAANHLYGILTVSDSTHAARLMLMGQYTAANFVAASDGHGGTLITDPPAGQQGLVLAHG